MSKLLVDMIEAVAYEKSMPEDLVRAAMESAIAALARREQKVPTGTFRAEIAADGTVSAFRTWKVVDEVVDADKEIARSSLAKADSGKETIEEAVETPKWTRQGLQVVKQVLAQKLKQGLRSTIAEAWSDRVGDVVLGVVKRVDKTRIVIDLGEPVEGVISGKDRIFGETFKVGSRCRALVKTVNAEGQGPVITLSRAADEFLAELIAIEVPEVEMGQVVIRGIARDPGQRAKILVEGKNGLRNNPAAVCVGMRGTRSQSISNDVNGERMEFIEWKDDLAERIISSLAPADIQSLTIDESKQRVLVGVPKENLARAIGSRGQNVRLASKLIGMNIELMSVEDLQALTEKEDQEAMMELVNALDVDEEIAALLIAEGFVSIEDIALCPIGDLLAVAELDEEIVNELRERASNALLIQEMEKEPEPITSLDQLDGISMDDVEILVKQGISTLEQLAEMGLMDVIWNEDRDDELEAWIMEARTAVGMI